ncbi:MAG: hypothetical protein QOE06_81 [Thermoleophilaceae bacterium]|jgi:hypothetical protein|nr:hypothetical protein [Thermoleophilaceae bacterium]
MHSQLEILVALLAVALGAVLVPIVRPIPEVAFVLQCSGAGGLFGAAWAVTRRPGETGAIGKLTATGSVVGATGGLLIVGVEALPL